MGNQRINLGLQTKLGQRILITPMMRQSLELLQIPITELLQELNTYVEENPTLESVDLDQNIDKDDEQAGSPETSTEDLLADMKTPDWDNYIDDGSSHDYSFSPSSNLDDDEYNYEHFVSSEDTLCEYLNSQLYIIELSETQYNIGEHIIGNLSDDGYFRYGAVALAADLNVSEGDVSELLDIIKKFEPTGIASQSLAECIIAQLDEVGASEGEIIQIRELFELYEYELTTYRYDDIVKKAGIDLESLNDLLGLIRKTNPTPGLNYSERRNTHILPDVYIVRDGDDFEVRTNEAGMPSLRLNNYYLKILRDATLDKDTKGYLEEKVKGALWILKSLNKRQQAIYKVTRAIVDVQKEYLLKGEAHLKPLRLKDIAEMTDLHESTVSRVTAGKYAMTDHGLLELKSFFSKGFDSDDGEDVSTRQIKVIIQELIDKEPVEKPYSDGKMEILLKGRGIDIARRTVAKYRDEMGINTMSQRKRMRRLDYEN